MSNNGVMYLTLLLKKYKSIFWSGICIAVIYFFADTLNNLINLNLQIVWVNLAIAILFAFLAVVINAFKFSMMLEIFLQKKIPHALWLKIFSLSSLMNNILPQGGLFYRGKFLKEFRDISYTDFLGVSYIFAFFGLISLISFIGVLFLLSFNKSYLLLLGLLTSILFLIKISAMKFISRWNFSYNRFNFYWSKLIIVSDLLGVGAKKPNFPYLIVLFFFGAVIDYCVFLFICYGFELSGDTQNILIIYIVLSLSWLIRLTPGNIGIQEVIVGASSNLLGIGFIWGVSISLVSRLIYILANSLIYFFTRFLSKY